MNPLIEKYFRGELTDPEESTLEKLLTDSEDTAWEFGQEAAAAYQRYGLPEPDLPGGENPDGPSNGMNPLTWMIPLLGLLFLGGFGWWKFHQTVVPVKLEVPAAQPAPVRVKKIVKHAEPTVKVLKQAVQAPVAPAPQAPTELPPDGGSLKEAGNNLKVVVKRETAGPATVRVVNSLGVEIRLLYSGTLQAGKWSFEWDGRSGDGRLVDPGKYSIQVQTEGSAQSREVVIH